ncbi:glycosyltransferase [Aromatoleum evansii]|uniref:glycosyltransferase n=1 Tax=Aromatoleum evansii TaxID=59406 RepID=UPI00145C8A1C|nr:glycosyltransferase [Aromatoleum evansii]NMG31021.1 galactosyldiacylglycerol synthase [Aromatoleum evansii]
MKTVDLIYFNAGGGHRATAVALGAVLRERKPDWQVRLVNLFEVLDPQNRFRAITGSAPEDWYNKRLARGWTIGMAQELKLLQTCIRLAHGPLVKQLQQHWAQTEPDLVVSLVPNFNRAMFESVASALPGVPYVTVLTDLADVPPNFWIEPDQAQHFICGTPKAVEQARALGHADERIHATSGMIIRPDFYEVSDFDRVRELRRHRLDPLRPTGIVLFGGHGSKAMLGIARKLAETTQLILVCGHNKSLARQLRALPQGAPRLVVEFSPDIPYYMRLADFFIGKPGPGSISEAVQQGLPVIIVDNAWTMPQERYNAEWVRDNHLGIVHGSFRTIDRAVAELLSRLEEFRTSVRRIDNRALFEVPEILHDILDDASRIHSDEAQAACHPPRFLRIPS